MSSKVVATVRKHRKAQDTQRSTYRGPQVHLEDNQGVRPGAIFATKWWQTFMVCFRLLNCWEHVWGVCPRWKTSDHVADGYRGHILYWCSCHRFADRTLEMAKELRTSANMTVDARTVAIFVPSVPRFWGRVYDSRRSTCGVVSFNGLRT